MGFFNFFKKKQDIKKIYFDELEDWLDSYVKKRRVNEKVQKFRDDVEKKIAEVKESMKELEETSLRNEKVPEKHRVIMEGNRKSYIQKVGRFLDELGVPEDYSEVSGFSVELSGKIDGLTKETQKNFFILKEFMRDPVLKLASQVKAIENSAVFLKEEIGKGGFDRIDEIRQLLVDFKNSEEILEELKIEKEKAEDELRKIIERENKLMVKVERLKVSSEFKEYKEIEKGLEQNKEEVRRLSQDLIDLFSTLDKALKKYKRGSFDEELIDDYIKDPVKALFKDGELKLVGVLGKLREGISKLDLKDKKEEKTKEALSKLSKDFLVEKRRGLQILFNVEEELKRKVRENIVARDIVEQESRLSLIEGGVKEKEALVEDINGKISKVDPGLIKEKIVNKVKEFDVVLEFGQNFIS